jgi:YesN/AraC family two-component response regulator
VRAGIRALLEQLPTVKIVGEAKDGREALRLVKELKPDLILMDVAMPGLNGLLTITHHASHPLIRQTLRYSPIVQLLDSIYTPTAR